MNRVKEEVQIIEILDYEKTASKESDTISGFMVNDRRDDVVNAIVGTRCDRTKKRIV